MKDHPAIVFFAFPSKLRLQRPGAGEAFSLIELLVSIVIIALLLALAFPVTQQIRSQGKTVKCVSNARQINLCLLNYASLHNNTLPRWISGRELVPKGASPGSSGGTNTGMTWMRSLVAEGFMPESSPAWKCPADTSPRSAISFAMNANVAGYSLSNINQQSNTILTTERYDDVGWKSIDLATYVAAANAQGMTNHHDKKITCVFVDGHAEVLPLNTSIENLQPPNSRWIQKD